MGDAFRSRTLLFLVLVLAALLGAPAQAQRAGTSFDHFSTGFPLAGAHFSVDCTSCHIGGRFKGTPRQCAGCHNGSVASGKSRTHIRTTNTCERCHVETAWQQVRYDHSQAIGVCASCHNGTQARGRPATHVASSAGWETRPPDTILVPSASLTPNSIHTRC